MDGGFNMTREELYKMFGPLLLEAVVLCAKDEINVLRVKLGLPERTNEQIRISLENKLSTLPKYDWMNKGI